MKIAIVGAGFCGLAVAWHLLQDPKYTVLLIDQKGIGQGASGVPVGLLHYYAGPKASLSWMAHAAYPEAISLLDIASTQLGRKVYTNSGILRPEIAGMDFRSAKNMPDTEWWDVAKCQSMIPELREIPGLFIRSGCIVDCPLYCQGLWQACQARGATFEQGHIAHAEELSGYAATIFSVGAGQTEIQALNAPSVSLIKGQTLELEWQRSEPLPFALNSSLQFSQKDQASVFAGATFERRWQHAAEDPSCEVELRAKIDKMAVNFSQLPLKRIWAGYRAATTDKRPFFAQSSRNVFCLGGMGSKGLLYHGWMAKQITKEINLCSLLT